MLKFIPKTFFDKMEYLGQFESVRQIYYVYGREDDFLLVTLNRNRLDSFNVNYIPRKCIEYINVNFCHKIVDRKEIEKKDTSIFGKRLERSFKILNTLYVLCVLGMAERVNDLEHTTMRFRITGKVLDVQRKAAVNTDSKTEDD